MIKNILLVGTGSFVGGILRYLISILIKYQSGFPWATFIVNIAGCLIIGLLWGWSSRSSSLSENVMLLLSVGFCGGFTTFSTFSKESVALLQAGNYLTLAVYIASSIAIGILFAALGYIITK